MKSALMISVLTAANILTGCSTQGHGTSGVSSNQTQSSPAVPGPEASDPDSTANDPSKAFTDFKWSCFDNDENYLGLTFDKTLMNNDEVNRILETNTSDLAVTDRVLLGNRIDIQKLVYTIGPGNFLR